MQKVFHFLFATVLTRRAGVIYDPIYRPRGSDMKKREELLSWRSKYWRLGLRRPWHWCLLGFLCLFIASAAAWCLLSPALRDARIVLPGGEVIHRMQNAAYYWSWISLYLLLVTGPLTCCLWSFRGAVLSHRCMRCEKA